MSHVMDVDEGMLREFYLHIFCLPLEQNFPGSTHVKLLFTCSLQFPARSADVAVDKVKLLLAIF